MKRLLPLLLTLSPTLLPAGEHTVTPAPFEVTVPVQGVLLPEKSHALQIDPQSWTNFKILDVKAQGAPVRKGEAVVQIDTEEIDRQIEAGETGAKLRKMALANAERELANLEASTAWKLAVAKRTYKRTYKRRR